MFTTWLEVCYITGQLLLFYILYIHAHRICNSQPELLLYVEHIIYKICDKIDVIYYIQGPVLVVTPKKQLAGPYPQRLT